MSWWTGALIRDGLAAWLLWVVWHHAHWSVALCLTLCCVAIEAHNLTMILRKENDKIEAETIAAFKKLTNQRGTTKQGMTKP